MVPVLRSLLLTLRTWARSRAALHLDISALRHQWDVLQRIRPPRVRLAKTDHWRRVMLARFWSGWRASLVIVTPETVIAHRTAAPATLADGAHVSHESGRPDRRGGFLRGADRDLPPRVRAGGAGPRSAPHAPWQTPFVERCVGSARRECFDHVIAFSDAGVRTLMTRYGSYYEQARTHVALDKDATLPGPVMAPGEGDIVASPEVGGLHHRYERRAA